MMNRCQTSAVLNFNMRRYTMAGMSDEVAAQWLVALENNGGNLTAMAAAQGPDLAAAAAAVQAQSLGSPKDLAAVAVAYKEGVAAAADALYPPKGDPLAVAAPFNGDAAPSTSAAPGVVEYEAGRRSFTRVQTRDKCA
jgi:hypothetical protein